MSTGRSEHQRKPRFFIGIDEIGDFTLCLARGIRELGFDVTNVVLERTPAWRHNHSYYTRLIKHPNRTAAAFNVMNEFFRSAFSHDIFVFTNAGSFTSYGLFSRWLRPLAYSDLYLLRGMGKKIVVTTHGSDIRSPALYAQWLKEQEIPYSYMSDNPHQEHDDTLKRIRAQKICRLADKIFANPLIAQLLTVPYEYIWLPIDLSETTYDVSDAHEPLIVHAPSSRRLKGTHHVLDVVARLQAEGFRFRFQLCEGMNNRELRKLLSQADIVIDQFDPVYGLLGVEAMASGCVLVGGAVPGFCFPEDVPAVTTNPNTLLPNLRLLLSNPEQRKALARRGRAYVEKYHDYRVVAREFVTAIGVSGDLLNPGLNSTLASEWNPFANGRIRRTV